MINYYKVLNLTNHATPMEIKRAYRKLALKYHPDSNSGFASEDRFIAVHEAYTILIDENKRKIYNQLLDNELNYASFFNSTVTEENESNSNFSKKSKDLENWIFEARGLAFKYLKMGYSTFSNSIKKGLHHGNRILELTCMVVMFIPMILMATVFYFGYTLKMFGDGSLIFGVILVILSPIILFFAWMLLRGIFEEIVDYYKE